MTTLHHDAVTRHTGKTIQTAHVEDELASIDAAIGNLAGLTAIASAYRSSVAAALGRLAAGTGLTWDLNIDGVSGNPVLRFRTSGGNVGTITYDGSDFIFSPALTAIAAAVVADSVQTDALGIGLTPVSSAAAITDVEEAYTTGELDTEAEVIAAVNAQGTAINDILAALRAMGIILGATGSAPSAPTLNAISNVDEDGNYTVDWETSAEATSYTLQEDDNGSFTSPATAYSGVNTSLDVTGKAAGTWYYRVKATNIHGDSAWSSTQSTTVAATGLSGLQPYVKALLLMSGTGDSSAIGVDASDNAYDFTSTAYPDAVAGPDTDTAADFDGSAEYLELASQALDTHQSVTICGWVKFPATWAGSDRLFESSQGTSGGFGGVQITTSATAETLTYTVYTGGSSGNYLNTINKNGFTEDTWHFFAMTNKQTAAASALRGYIGLKGSTWADATLTGSGLNPVNDTMDATPAQDSANPHIGSNIAETGNWFLGAMKNFMIVTGALDSATLTDVLQLGPDFAWADLTGITPTFE